MFLPGDRQISRGTHMDDTDTATIELTRAEAREVINALAEYETGATGRDEERALNVEDLLQREFGFKEEHFGGDRGYLDTFTNIFNEPDTEHEVQLSRVEAREIVHALDELGQHGEYSADADAETVQDLRARFADTFDLDDESGSVV